MLGRWPHANRPCSSNPHPPQDTTTNEIQLPGTFVARSTHSKTRHDSTTGHRTPCIPGGTAHEHHVRKRPGHGPNSHGRPLSQLLMQLLLLALVGQPLQVTNLREEAVRGPLARSGCPAQGGFRLLLFSEFSACSVLVLGSVVQFFSFLATGARARRRRTTRVPLRAIWEAQKQPCSLLSDLGSFH